MRTTYRALAYLVAVGVVVQAAVIAFAFFGLSRWVQNGGVLDQAALEGDGFTGAVGLAIHSVTGEMVIPVVAVALLAASFFARIPRGVMGAAVVFVLVVLQVVLGFVSADVPGLGLLHGLGALLLFAAACVAARLPDATPAAVDGPASPDRNRVA